MINFLNFVSSRKHTYQKPVKYDPTVDVTKVTFVDPHDYARYGALNAAARFRTRPGFINTLQVPYFFAFAYFHIRAFL